MLRKLLAIWSWTGGDGLVDLQVAKHTLDAIALLVERAVMLDCGATV